ncbi:hypothetical protein [Pyrococcus abyssi]|uniref:EamA domain-containing protein n=1 Tax=Pyrococcus abyssi (strain GE5 / Orsay) TaxID=272844 RepID=G8ZK01_PYRAB|nr:hypothetical protein [Pyrococcus abyssi]CCE71108.1 TPA: hypothetical protein PAB1080.5n [Pyrococcus abyssi GE5]
MRITKRDVFWVFIIAIWIYNTFALLDVLGIARIKGIVFYALTTIPPLFLYLYLIASPPEPDTKTIAKFGGASVAVLSILGGLHIVLK